VRIQLITAQLMTNTNSAQSVQDPIAYAQYAQDEYYSKEWESLVTKPTGGTSFHFEAALFGTTWCFYRKMYVIGLIVFLLGTIAALLAGVACGLLFPALSDIQLQVIAFASLGLLVRVPLGFIANKLYFKQATRVISKTIKEVGDDAAALQTELASRGGTSVPSLLLVIGLSILGRLV
jgi:Protein of unknown function (DUF2628)